MSNVKTIENLSTEHENQPRFMNVKQVSNYLQLNEKKIYALVSEGKIPGTKITGKWMFPKALIDNWIIESSHGGLLTDRLIVAGSDDSLMQRVIMQIASNIQSNALVSYTCTGTRLGLSLLSHHKADICAMHWGPYEESHLRHPALLQQYAQHQNWVLIRLFKREQGLLIDKDLLKAVDTDDLKGILETNLRWCSRQSGAGSQRFLQETLQHFMIQEDNLKISCTALSERDSASRIAMKQADVAPGTRSIATEFSLGFIPIGWEAFDVALYRGVYFRTLFQSLLEEIKTDTCQKLAEQLGGYDFAESGKLIWSAD
ncbi:MAG: helix-turn-helix transcriptional regulator [Gammaproteobacteria bacterium]|nr:helix-turn-helix transcriptional regulator [Gammaproteobacteria bacterium]